MSSACKEEGNAQAGAGVWFPTDDAHSFSVKLPSCIDTAQAAEFATLLVTLQHTQTTDELMITSALKGLFDGLTKSLPLWEDRGWISIQNKEFIKKVAAELRMHGGNTIFWKAEKKEPGLGSALHNAKEAI